MRNAMNPGAGGGGAGAVPAAVVPPPLPQTAAFYIAVNGQQQGPLDLNALSARAREGSLTRSTLVWKQGMANWQAAESVPEVAGIFGAVPPPLPH
jgi:hypothetical protein